MKTTNYFSKSYSGIFGNQVILKNRKGKTFMTMPVFRPVKATEKQCTYRMQFAYASTLATNLLKDPDILANYRSKLSPGLTAYNLALKDCIRQVVSVNKAAPGI